MKNLSRILIALFVAAILLEVSFRVYHKIHPSYIFTNESYNRFRGRPSSECFGFRLNSKGFNDIEYALGKKQGVYRILGIGDSFVFGAVPYQHNFLTLLEEGLNRNKTNFEVINMGIPRTGVDSYLSLLLREGVALKPDLVICCFFVGNDFTDPSFTGEYDTLFLFSFLKFLFKISPLHVNPGATAASKYSDYKDDQPDFTPKEYLQIERERSFIFLKEYRYSSRYINYTASYLARMKKVCDEADAAFLVVLIPDELQVDSGLQEKVIRADNKHTRQDFDFLLPNRLLAERFSTLGIDYIDLFDDFSRVTKEKRLYKPQNTHWNIAGNALAASLILKKVPGILNATRPGIFQGLNSDNP